ncbi:MAG: response regulator [Candidatus Bathyarchaeota archaeon]|nr:response regulator [Candidatus Bathyarchaeota archaeon]
MDDDTSQLEMLQIFMGQLDASVEVVSCGNPLEALKLVAEDGFDCVVSDYLMPPMNGVEFASRVKELKDIPFILYTGQGSEEVAEHAFQAGADDYIRKEIEPSHYEVLLNRIRHAVDKYRAEQIYRVIFDSNPEAILVIIDNVIEYSNNSAVSLFDVDSQLDLVGRRFTDFVLDNDLDEVGWMSLQRIITDNRVVPFELALRCDSGNLRLVMGTLQNMYFFGKPAQIYFLRDITERREMERGLMHTQHQFDRIFNHSLIGIGLIDKSHKIHRCNLLFRKILGLESCASRFGLLDEPRIFSKIHGRLLPGESIRFDLALDFKHLCDGGFLESNRVDVGQVELIFSPVMLEKGADGYLVQVMEQ